MLNLGNALLFIIFLIAKDQVSMRKKENLSCLRMLKLLLIKNYIELRFKVKECWKNVLFKVNSTIRLREESSKQRKKQLKRFWNGGESKELKQNRKKDKETTLRLQFSLKDWLMLGRKIVWRTYAWWRFFIQTETFIRT